MKKRIYLFNQFTRELLYSFFLELIHHPCSIAIDVIPEYRSKPVCLCAAILPLLLCCSFCFWYSFSIIKDNPWIVEGWDWDKLNRHCHRSHSHFGRSQLYGAVSVWFKIVQRKAHRSYHVLYHFPSHHSITFLSKCLPFRLRCALAVVLPDKIDVVKGETTANLHSVG